jgi:hypothetical protein
MNLNSLKSFTEANYGKNELAAEGKREATPQT